MKKLLIVWLCALVLLSQEIIAVSINGTDAVSMTTINETDSSIYLDFINATESEMVTENLNGTTNGTGCEERDNAFPYYFGTRHLKCFQKGKRKRDAPSRCTFRPLHRFIYYRGVYFEFGIGDKKEAIYGKAPANVRKWKLEKEPAGYSTLSVGCLIGCLKKYIKKFGEYNATLNNCHHFANKLSEILCDHKKCPDWCKS